MTDSNTPASGEARLRRRRQAFLRYLAIAFFAAALTGFFSGYFLKDFQDGQLPVWIPVTTCIAALAAFAWFTRDYFRRVDELDLLDNLWAHLIGLYGGLIVFMGWYFFAELSLMAYPSAIGIVSAMLLITFVAYGIRKLGWR